MSQQLSDLQECVDLFEGVRPDRVDRDRGIVRDVKCLGWTSKNGNEYDPTGVNPTVYEGRFVNINHTKDGQNSSAYDRLGRIVNVRKERDGLYGDLEILKSHPLAGAVFEAAERMPGVYGLSHRIERGDYRGRRIGRNGVKVESIQRVQSLDLVADPATVSGLFESRRKSVKLTLKSLAESLKATRPQYARALVEMAEAGILSPDTSMPEELPAESSGSDHEQAILDACKACIDDSGLPINEKMAKIRKLLSLAGGEAEPEKGGDDMDTEKGGRKESVDPELARLRAEKRVRKAAKEAGIDVSETLLESVRPDLTDAQIKSLVEDWKRHRSNGSSQQQHGSGARSATPLKDLQESRQQQKEESGDFTDEQRAARVARLRQSR